MSFHQNVGLISVNIKFCVISLSTLIATLFKCLCKTIGIQPYLKKRKTKCLSTYFFHALLFKNKYRKEQKRGFKITRYFQNIWNNYYKNIFDRFFFLQQIIFELNDNFWGQSKLKFIEKSTG